MSLVITDASHANEEEELLVNGLSVCGVPQEPRCEDDLRCHTIPMGRRTGEAYIR